MSRGLAAIGGREIVRDDHFHFVDLVSCRRVKTNAGISHCVRLSFQHAAMDRSLIHHNHSPHTDLYYAADQRDSPATTTNTTP